MKEIKVPKKRLKLENVGGAVDKIYGIPNTIIKTHIPIMVIKVALLGFEVKYRLLCQRKNS